MRIKNGKEPLDATGIHPEIHKQVYAFIEEELGIKKKNLKLPLDSISRRDASLTRPNHAILRDPSEVTVRTRAEKYGIGYETMEDVIKELQRPGLDPREEIEPPSFKSDVVDIKDLQIGMELEGVVRNVTDF
ncbi:MAG: hypothetical protein LBI53_00035 [Candidatus Peribacteria bacterium]|nr:hypothetical protein [Candidatus Peribacteria bacterium]